MKIKTHSTIKTFAGLSFSLISLSALSSTVLAQGISLTPISSNRALSLVVDQSNDSTTGSCEAAVKGQCNLRAAVAKAVATSGEVNIRLTVDSPITAGEISLPSPAQTLVPFNVTITSGKERKITGNKTSKLFNIGANVNVTLNNTFITGFQAYNSGVISNAGSLTLSKTVIRENKASCFGNGAMTAFATCWAGAIENTGALVLKDGTRFRANTVEATASTASFTNANASGGAIVSSGSITFDGEVTFRANIASATANSGYHGSMPGGASALSSGGAISNSGTIVITANGEGKCHFINNEARATASTANGDATHASSGGAISTVELPGVNLTSSCTFEGNVADSDAEVNVRL